MNMIIPRRVLAKLPRWVSYWSGVAMRRAKAVRRPRILMYHIIGNDDLSIKQFDWQLQFIRNEFELIGLGQLIDRLASDSVSGHEIVITFDDGVRNHFTVAYPMLRAHGAPATFFVCPGLIESGAWIWRTELRLRLACLKGEERKRLAREWDCPGVCIEEMMEWTKGLPHAARNKLQGAVIALTQEFEPASVDIDRHAPLTWQQLGDMDERLITIGSHTSTHPILTTLPHELLEAEVSGSRRMLEQRLGRVVDLFCYPNGANDQAAVEVVRRSFRAATTTRQDFVTAGCDIHTLPRIPAGGSQATFVRRLCRPTA